MKFAVFLFGVLAAGAAVAQATNDDTASTENWWDKVGAGFFSDENMQTPRSEFEIRAHWTALSVDDQAAIRARCAEAEDGGSGLAVSTQESDAETGEAGATVDAPPTPVLPEQSADDAATTTTGSSAGAEVQVAESATAPAPYTGLAGSADDTRHITICALIRDL